MQRLIDMGVRIDHPDEKLRTPFLNFYSMNCEFEIGRAEKLLKLGANVNQIDASGMYALKYALIRRSGPQIEKLYRIYKANVNLLDKKGRNLLHHAVNLSSATADATFEIEQQIIDMGVAINHKDERGRTPLHYAFVKISKWAETS